MTYDPVKFAQGIDEELSQIRETLILKNKDYGDSALSPIGVFAEPDPVQQLCVQIDHKLKRIQNTKAGSAIQEDTLKDLIGYLILLRIALKNP
jgi:hypothetical protein